jgi:hypothetical protein
VVTVTVTGPTEPGGVAKVHVVDVHVAVTGSPSTVTVPPPRFVPVIVTCVPPLVGPLAGMMDVTVGAAT